MKKVLRLLLVILTAFVLTGCKKSTTLVACVGPNPDTIDPALNSSVDGATYIIHAFSGLVGWAQDEDGNLELVADCAKALPEAEATADGKVKYVFELKDGLKWSDGTELTAADFVYSWNRAASLETASDYGYMFDVIDGYAEMTAADDDGVALNPDAKLNVTASTDGKSITIILPVDVPYFLELCAFPTYMPVKPSIV